MDIGYWENYYTRKIVSSKNTPFSEFCLPYFSENSRILELGCGNGRDAVFFAKLGYDVIAIDQVEGELNNLRRNFAKKNIHFITGDFTQLNSTLDIVLNRGGLFDAIYSRFTLHSISSQEEERLLQDILLFLNKKGILAIEARGLKNSLCGIGKKIEEDDSGVAYLYNDHYRRFIDFNALCKRLQDNFEIIYAEEREGFAPYNDENDIFFRIIAKKR